MKDVATIFSSVVDLMKTEFTIYGVTLSFWQIFILSILIGFAGSALYKLFGGD